MARILSVDDEPAISMVFAELLATEGHEVIPAGDSRSGIAMIPKVNPDLVTTDINNPGPGGLAVVRATKEHNSKTPVIVVSGTGCVGDFVEAIKLGAFACLDKPFTLLDLQAAVERALKCEGSLLRQRWRFDEMAGDEEKRREFVTRSKELPDANACDWDGWTLLHSAALWGEREVAEILISKGADVNARAVRRWTPLHLSAHDGQTEIIRTLAAHQVDIHVCDEEGRTPLHWAAARRSEKSVKVLLDIGCDSNAQDRFGRTPLHCAAAQGLVDVLRALLEANCKPDVCDNYGKTATQLALDNKHLLAAELLESHGRPE